MDYRNILVKEAIEGKWSWRDLALEVLSRISAEEGKEVFKSLIKSEQFFPGEK